VATARLQGNIRNSAFLLNVYSYRNGVSPETKEALLRITEEVRAFAASLTPGTQLKEGWRVLIREATPEKFSVTVTNVDPRASIPLVSLSKGTYKADTTNRGTAEMTLIDLIDKGGAGPYTILPFRASVLVWIDQETGRKRFAKIVMREYISASTGKPGVMVGTGVIQRSQLLAQRLIAEYRASGGAGFRARQRVRR
jgi:hypothetical protein